MDEIILTKYIDYNIKKLWIRKILSFKNNFFIFLKKIFFF